MMATEYELVITNPTGRTATRPAEWVSLRWRAVLNAPGEAFLMLPGDFDLDLIKADGRLYIQRQVDGGPVMLIGDAPWLIRAWGYERNGDAVFLRAVHATEILSRRIIPYAPGSAQATKTDYADDMMKEIVTEQFGASAGTGRDLSDWLTVASDLSQGPTITKDVARRNVLAALQDIARDAAEEGTNLYFDITGSDSLVFRTYKSYRGRDLSATLVLSPEWGTLAEAELTYDYSREVTVAYAGEALASAEASSRSARSVFGRREAYTSAQGDEDALEAAAQAALREGRPRVIFEGTFSPGAFQYGRDWSLGNRIAWKFQGESGTAIIEEIDGRIERGGRETITPRMRVE